MRGISASVLAKHLLYAQQSDLLDRPLWPCPVLPAFAVVLSVGAGSRAGTLAWRPARLLRPCVPVSCLSAQASGTLGRKLLTKRTSRVRTLCKAKGIDDKYCTTWSLMADICSNKYGQSFPVKIVHNMRCAPRAPGLTSSFTTKA